MKSRAKMDCGTNFWKFWGILVLEGKKCYNIADIV